jgi:hypothetical protein
MESHAVIRPYGLFLFRQGIAIYSNYECFGLKWEEGVKNTSDIFHQFTHGEVESIGG